MMIANLMLCIYLALRARSHPAAGVLSSLAGGNITAPLDLPAFTDFTTQAEIDVFQRTFPLYTTPFINSTIQALDPFGDAPNEPTDEPTAKRQASPATSEHEHHLSRRVPSVSACHDRTKRLFLRKELNWLLSTLNEVILMNASHPVWRALVSDQLRDSPEALTRFRTLVGYINSTIYNPDFHFGLQCDQGQDKCRIPIPDPTTGGVGYSVAYANMYLPNNFINFCNRFFQLKSNTEDVTCKPANYMSLYATSSQLFTHEIIHQVYFSLFVSNSNIQLYDITYGFGNCADLARGYCNEEVDTVPVDEKVCHDPALSLTNVDSLAWLINGYYWYEYCDAKGFQIPLH